MAKGDWQVKVIDSVVTLVYTSYGVTTFTVEALESGSLKVTVNYSSSKGIVDESSIGTTAVDRHTIEVVNV